MSWINRWWRRAVALVVIAIVGWFAFGPRGGSRRDAPASKVMDEQTRADGQRQLIRNPVRSFLIPRNRSQPVVPPQR